MKFISLSLLEIAGRVDGEVEGEGSVMITGVAALAEAGAGDLAFVARPRYHKLLATTKASAVIVGRGIKTTAPEGVSLLRVDHPHLAFARALEFLVESPRPPAGVHPGAHVEPSAKLGSQTAVMAGAYVGEQAEIGRGSVLYPGAVVMEGARIGADCLLYPGAVVREECRLGDRVILHANATIGSDGYGFVTEGARHIKVPQVGNVIIGDDVEIGACSCVDRAALGSTVIGSGTKTDDLVMIGHGAQIGENTLLVTQVAVGGSATVGEGTIMGARSGLIDNRTVGAGSLLYSTAVVTKSLPPGSVVSGNPARPHKEALRQEAMLAKMEKLLARVDQLEKEVEKLKGE